MASKRHFYWKKAAAIRGPPWTLPRCTRRVESWSVPTVELVVREKTLQPCTTVETGCTNTVLGRSCTWREGLYKNLSRRSAYITAEAGD